MPRTRFLGREKLQRRFKKLPELVRLNLRAEFAKGADDLKKAMRARVPKRTRKLMRTITWRWGTSGKVKYAFGATGQRNANDLSIVVTAGGQVDGLDIRYAHIVEFGSAPHPQGGIFKGTGVMHPGTDPQPFFFPTYRAKRRSLRSRRRRAFRKAIEASAGA